MKEKLRGAAKTGASAGWGVAAKKLFTYPALHSVRLHDWRLGVMFKLAQLGVFLYILVYLLLVKQRYLDVTKPVGNIYVSIRSPQQNDSSFIPPTPDQLPYCRTSTNPYNSTRLPCLYWSEELVLHPFAEKDAVFITTRVGLATKVLLLNRDVNATQVDEFGYLLPNCDFAQPNCMFTIQENYPYTGDQYVALVEDFTVAIIHAWQALKFKISSTAGEISGKLVDNKGNTIYPEQGRESFGEQGKIDVFLLSTLLKAAGSSLDTNTSGIVPRFDGVVLIVIISYTNIQSGYYYTDKYTYEFKVVQVSGVSFSSLQEVYTKNPTTLVTFDRTGIRLIVVQTGNIGRFDFQALLLSFTSGLALLKVAQLLVDFLGGLCWKNMVRDSYPMMDDVEEDLKSNDKKGNIKAFLKYPFMRLRDKDGNVGDRVMPWMLDRGSRDQPLEDGGENGNGNGNGHENGNGNGNGHANGNGHDNGSGDEVDL